MDIPLSLKVENSSDLRIPSIIFKIHQRGDFGESVRLEKRNDLIGQFENEILGENDNFISLQACDVF